MYKNNKCNVWLSNYLSTLVCKVFLLLYILHRILKKGTSLLKNSVCETMSQLNDNISTFIRKIFQFCRSEHFFPRFSQQHFRFPKVLPSPFSFSVTLCGFQQREKEVNSLDVVNGFLIGCHLIRSLFNWHKRDYAPQTFSFDSFDLQLFSYSAQISRIGVSVAINTEIRVSFERWWRSRKSLKNSFSDDKKISRVWTDQTKRSNMIKCCKAHWEGPPCLDVLWWMSFHVTTLLLPLVVERPMVKMSLWSKARCSSFRMAWPSGESGRYAVRDTPWYGWPGFGCSSCKNTRFNWLLVLEILYSCGFYRIWH